MVMAVNQTTIPPVASEEQFGEGLEAELANAGAAFEQQQVAAQAGQVQADPVVNWFRDQFEGLSQDATPDTIAQSIIDLQTQAEEAEQLRQQLAAMQAAAAQEAAQRPTTQVQMPGSAAASAQTQQQAAAQQAAVAEAVRRLEAIRVSPENQQLLTSKFVKMDPETGLYEPIVQMPNVYRAVQEKNNAIIRQREILDSVTGDFYGALDEGVPMTKAYRAQQERIDALEKMLEERFSTVQKTIQQTEDDRFLWQNQDLLFMKDPANPNNVVASPAGDMYQALVSSGKMTREEALNFVKPYAEKFNAVSTAVPAPAQQAAQQKPVRFTEKLRRRGGSNAGVKPAETHAAVDLGVPRGAFRTNWEDVVAAAREQAHQN